MFRTGKPAHVFAEATTGEMIELLFTSAMERENRLSAKAIEVAKCETVRRHERITVHIRALLHLRGQFQTTTIRDISIGGACLEGAYGVIPSDKLIIELTNGRKLAARARWWLCGRCGVSFAEELAKSDPLLVSNNRESRSA